MNFDDEFDFDTFDDDDILLRATIAPNPDDVFDMLTLMHLEAGRIRERDLDSLTWDNLPQMPEDANDRDRALWLAIQAYELCFEDPELSADLAEEAMACDATCIDAYIARWFTMDIEHHEAAVMAARGAVFGQQLVDSTKSVREHADVWMYPRIRGAVRAFAALALTNWAQGNRDDAIAAAEHVLKLAPYDEVGMTPHLANWYLATKQNKRAHRLLREYEEDFVAPVEYARALVAFVREGREKARPLLLSAAEQHPLILSQMKLSADGELESTGLPFPAHYYVAFSVEEALVWHPPIEDTWRSVEGAFEWATNCADEPEFHSHLQAGALKAVEELRDFAELTGDDNLASLLEEIDLDDDEDSNHGPELRLL